MVAPLAADDANPAHEVITLFIEAIDPFDHAGGTRRAIDFDNQVRRILGASNLYTPANLLQTGYSTLRAAITDPGPQGAGWPTIDALRGKFILVMTGANNDGYYNDEGGGINGVAFSAVEPDRHYRSTSDLARDPVNRIFYNVGECLNFTCTPGDDPWRTMDSLNAVQTWVARLFRLRPTDPYYHVYDAALSDTKNTNFKATNYFLEPDFQMLTSNRFPFRCVSWATGCSTESLVEQVAGPQLITPDQGPGGIDRGRQR